MLEVYDKRESMRQLLEQAETARKEVGQRISQKRKAELGQFMTPATVARFMATLFLPSTLKTARVLDAGAGMGALSGAALDRFAAEDFPFQHVQVVAYEIDPKLRELLSETLAKYQGRFDIDISFRRGDFIEEAVKLIFQGEERFTHAILNPPYKKIHSASRHRFLLRRIGIETVNLYSAFVALIIELMQPCGQIVAIMPRSFCNGPYYRAFRELILAKTAIKYIHLFVRATVLSEMTMSYRKISSFCFNATSYRRTLPSLRQQMIVLTTWKLIFTRLTGSFFQMIRSLHKYSHFH